MKRLAIIFLLIPFIGLSQTFEFSNSDDGWSVLGNFTASTNPTFYTLTTLPGNGELKNPTCGNEAAGVNTEEASWVSVTLRNNDSNGPDFMRMSYPKVDGGRIYKNIDITNGDTEFVTYWIDLSNATHWVGTIDDFKLHFKSAGNTDYILPADPVSIDIDRIEFALEPSTTLKNAYHFNTNGDPEGFSALNGSISGPSGGILTFTPNPDKYAKLEQIMHHVDASSNKFVHITLKNNSPLNNQLRLVSDGLDGTKTMEISVNDNTEKTYTFDLTGEALWTGNQLFTVGIGSLESGKALDDGTAEFNSIVFDNSVGVTPSYAPELSVYPNPASEMVFIGTVDPVSSIMISDITGKLVLAEENLTTGQVDVSGLKPGVYMVKIETTRRGIATHRLIISR